MWKQIQERIKRKINRALLDTKTFLLALRCSSHALTDTKQDSLYLILCHLPISYLILKLCRRELFFLNKPLNLLSAVKMHLSSTYQHILQNSANLTQERADCYRHTWKKKMQHPISFDFFQIKHIGKAPKEGMSEE